jgi:hypothetical protein
MKKLFKITIFTLLIMMFSNFAISTSYAQNADENESIVEVDVTDSGEYKDKFDNLKPERPGDVPETRLLEDFIPQLIRQLFRFAWLAILIAFIASGVMFVMAFDSDDRITKAKHMIYYTLIGFGVITLAFSVVKAITNIDFFNFI